MIVSSKQALLVSSTENKEFFLFDPKTTAVLHKYRTQETLSPPLAYHQHSQQIICQQINKTFISVWNWDAQEVESKISMTESMSFVGFSQDGHYLYGGGSTGTLFMWEMPSGLLLKKKTLHSSAIVNIMPYSNNHIITVSKTELKIWPLSSLLLEEDNCPPLKHHNSLLDIISSGISRNILGVLTHKNVTLINGSLSHQQKQLKVYQKIDYEYATAMAISQTKVYIGDGKGTIDLVQLLPPDEQKLELHFRIQNGELDISRPKKRRVLTGSTHPVSALVYLQTLAYLVSGHSNGSLIIWHNHEIKKNLHLFKTEITGLTQLLKPKQMKIYQAEKIKTLHKYQLSKQQEPLVIVPSRTENELTSTFRREEDETDQEGVILDRIMGSLRQPEKLLREELLVLRQEKKKLLEANMHYFNLLAP